MQAAASDKLGRMSAGQIRGSLTFDGFEWMDFVRRWESPETQTDFDLSTYLGRY